MAKKTPLEHGINGLLFFGGLEIGYNVGGQTCSAPQTTELRVQGAEGGGAAEKTLWKWVWMANGKTLFWTTLVSFISRSWMPLLGGLVSIGDMHFSYRYAVSCGKKAQSGASTTTAEPGPEPATVLRMRP